MNKEYNSTKSIREILLDEMKHGIYAECDRLPREIVLAETLSISRTQLRDALSDLEREGFITRRHGVGTVINRHVLHVKNRMDIEMEFLDIIRENGCEPSVSFIKVSEDEADEQAASKLCIQTGAPVIRICLLCCADNRPAIYSEDVLDKRLVKRDYKSEDFQLIVFQFLKKFCDIEAYMDLTQLHAVIADEYLAEILEIPQGTPLLNMEEVDYDIEGNPVFYSRQFFVDELIQHTVLRKKF